MSGKAAVYKIQKEDRALQKKVLCRKKILRNYLSRFSKGPVDLSALYFQQYSQWSKELELRIYKTLYGILKFCQGLS